MQLHRISLYLAIEGPPNLGPRPSLLCPWSPGSSAVSSPSPVPAQSSPRHVDPLHQPRPSTSCTPEPALHLGNPTTPPDCCHLCCPPPPTHSPTSRPASKQPCSVVLSCRSSPLAVPAWAIANHARTLWVQHSTARPIAPPDINQPGPNVRQPPAVRLTPAVCLNHPSFLVRFGPSPANPHPVLARYNPRRSLAPRAAVLCLAIVPTIPSATASRVPVASTRPAARPRPSAIGVGVGDCACCEKSRPRSINRPPSAPFPLLQEPAHATLRAQDRHDDVHSHAAEGRR